MSKIGFFSIYAVPTQKFGGNLVRQCDELNEFVSRGCRIELVKLLLRNGWSKSRLACELGITRQAVHLWLRREETHPCNPNLGRLIDLALETNRAGAVKILTEELKTFQTLLLKKCQVGT